MKNDPLIERSQKIQNNATKLLVEKKIIPFLETNGKIFYSGSYFLNLMTWNDIDLQFICNKGIDVARLFSNLIFELSQEEDFIRANLINFTKSYRPKMPRGLCLVLYFDNPQLGGPWKIDLWSLAEKDFLANRLEVEEQLKLIQPETKSLILQIKNNLMLEGRVPQGVSRLIYQAVLKENLRNPNEIYHFLKTHEIKTPLQFN